MILIQKKNYCQLLWHYSVKKYCNIAMLIIQFSLAHYLHSQINFIRISNVIRT